jgi:hypothetical protein
MRQTGPHGDRERMVIQSADRHLKKLKNWLPYVSFASVICTDKDLVGGSDDKLFQATGLRKYAI